MFGWHAGAYAANVYCVVKHVYLSKEIAKQNV